MKRITLLFAAALVAGDWPSLGLDEARTRATVEPVGTSLPLRWSASLGSRIIATPVIADGYVIVGTEWGEVRAFRESDGAALWTFDAGGDVIGSPTIRNGRVFAANRDGDLFALRLIDGTQVWIAALSGSIYSTPVVLDGRLIAGVGAPGGAVVALDPDTGATLWSTAVGGSVYASALRDGGSIWIGATPGNYHRLDLATGALQQTIATTGDVLLSSPSAGFGEIFALPGGVDMNLHALGAWTLEMTDPSPPTSGAITGVRLDTSSPVIAGDRVCFCVRFDYYLDTDGNGSTDRYAVREYAVAVDPAARVVTWRTSLGAQDSSQPSIIPTLGMCPTPVAAGARLIVGSAIEAKLRIIDVASGGVLGQATTDAPGRASVVLSNGRVLWGTDGGTLWCFGSGANQAPLPPVSGFSPADGESFATGIDTLAWEGSGDPDDPPANLRFIVRLDTDGEIIEDWAFEGVTPYGQKWISLPDPALWSGTFTYAVRAEDHEFARSAWSATQTYTASNTLAPPSDLVAVTGDGAVRLEWTASPTLGRDGYVIRWGTESATTTGTSLIVSGLTNGMTYAFEVRTVAADGTESAPATVEATPSRVGSIMIGATPYATLDAAAASVAMGQTILLGEGTFAIAQPFKLAGASMIGLSPHETRIDATGMQTGITLDGEEPMRLSGLTLFGAQYGIDVWSGVATIDHVVVRDQQVDGVLVTGPALVELIHATVVGNAGAGVIAYDGMLAVRNSIVIGNGRGLEAVEPGVLVSSYNDLFENDYVGCDPGEGDFMAPVSFVDEASGDYRVLDGEPTIDAGDPADPFDLEPAPNGGRVNVGAYGNTPWAAVMPSSAPAPGAEPVPSDAPAAVAATPVAGGGSSSGCSMSATAAVGTAWPGLFAALALTYFIRSAMRRGSCRRSRTA